MNERDLLIERLLDFGIYKINDKQLFELPIVDLEQELKKIMQNKGNDG
ncbi:Fur-regulated basic protein FbpA [Robertmurraya sp. FSL W8-0741]|nr:Fur-regulated basic protein FbpA [Robertmurraya siralis]